MVHISIELYDHQKEAIKNLKNGSILCGGVGTGKSRTALAYFFMLNGGQLEKEYGPMHDPPLDLYIITTARKRDTLEWEGEMTPFLLSTNPNVNLYSNKVVVDSWNNIKKYVDVEKAFFIFDEQRVVGRGAWVKAFLKITKKNRWILLSATPGDTWMDYVPVFIANGFYKNRTEFERTHVVYNRFAKFPKVDRYTDCARLVRQRRSILVNMKYKRETVSHKNYISVPYDKETYRTIAKNRWNPYKNKPMKNVSEFCSVMRKIVNSDYRRGEKIKELILDNPKTIIFYNFDYELEILRSISKELGIFSAELNGHKHDPVPDTDSWMYLVQYSSGSEAWNCISTDTIIFYSLNYSYRIMLQSAGRIDRLNTPYKDLYYYYITSNSPIDRGIRYTLSKKKSFNEKDFAGHISFG